MNHERNPLRHIPDEGLRHMVMQLLAWMWCIVFSIYFGSFLIFGLTAIAHFIVIVAIVITVVSFKKAEKYKHPNGVLNYEKIQGKYDDIW
jgi:Flp pilus assembly protein TadB|tara:strand:- start:268 stop:537 length:270 start_codon:yes stop_codon:yes gene_type:complete